jgi:DNA-binding NarL/FixJ family response regulator
VITVQLVDDQSLVRAGFHALLDAEDDIEVVAEAADGESAVLQAREHRPQVVLMDIRMPQVDGLQATAQITGDPELCDTRVVVLTTFELDEYVFGALRAGASGFLLKRTRPEDLIAAIHTIAAGDSLLSPSVTSRVIARMARQPARDNAALAELTPRELEVLELLAQGSSNAEIATALVIEESTVKTHVKRVLDKLGLRDRVQAVIFAYESGLRHQ